MIIEERMRVYIDSLSGGSTPFLEELEEKAGCDNVPIIRRETRNFLRTLLALKKPRSILEIGTAVGFSALYMCEYAVGPVSVVTIENDPERIRAAAENIRRAGREEQITLLAGDAGEILPSLPGQFDLVFLDAAKGQYINWLPSVLRLLSPGGVLVSDNVLQEGEIVESHYLVERRKRTIYKRMREFLFALTHDPLLTTTVLPLGDGVALSVRKEDASDENT